MSTITVVSPKTPFDAPVDWDTFQSCLNELCAIQSRPTPTPFDLKVARSVFNACSKALRDFQRQEALWRTVSAPTGGGKTTSALAFVAAYVRLGGTALITSFTRRDCDDLFRTLQLLLGDEVAIWTTDHDHTKHASNAESEVKKIEIERGYTPAAYFKRERLPGYRALICTHKSFKEHSEKMLTLEKGDQHPLILVDERPGEVDIGTFSYENFEQINRLCQERLGLDGEGVEPQITQAFGEACKLLGEAQNNFDRAKVYHSLSFSLSEHLLSALRGLVANRSLCARIAANSPFEQKDIAKAAKLILHSQPNIGQSFVRLRAGFTHGAGFVTYAPDWKLNPGTVLLDATSDIDGYVELTDVRHLEPVPEANYQNLTTHFLEGPRHIAQGNLKDIWKNSERELLAWLHKAVIENTRPGEHVLLVSKKTIIESIGLDTLDQDDRQINLCHFGIGVGSNQWRHCTSVFVFGDYVFPSHATVAETHGIKGTRFVVSDNTPIRGLRGDYRVTKDGRLLRWMKQLAMRGTARNLNSAGVAEPMKLFLLTNDSTLILRNWNRLFPSAPIPKTIEVTGIESTTSTAKRRNSRWSDVLKVIVSSEGPEVTSGELEAAIGFKLKDAVRGAQAQEKLQEDLKPLGWSVVFGRGRGQQTRFIKGAFTL